VAEHAGGCDVALVLADGLSAAAVNDHAQPLLALLVPQLQQAGLRLGPITLAEQARVAIGDEIGQLLGARLVLVLIGERPGLSAPRSLGAYFTYQPRPGLTDGTQLHFQHSARRPTLRRGGRQACFFAARNPPASALGRGA
jgi:ethanolamine ammonia-lyase small subunit